MIYREIDANRLRSVALFSGVSDAHFNRLLKAASLRHFAGRTLLFEEGERPAVLYTLIEGAVELFSEYHDRRCTIAVIRSIKPCALTAIVEGRNPLSARTLERSRVLLVPASTVHELIETDLGFARAVGDELASDCHQLIEDFKSQRLTTTVERLARWMLRCDQEAGGRGHFTIPHDKRTLAHYLGMAPENLSRNLAALASAGLVLRGRCVTLNDRPALAARAGLNSVAVDR